MTIIQTDEKELFKTIDKAIKEVKQASPPKYTEDNIFEKMYGPGIKGDHWPKKGMGTFIIFAKSPCIRPKYQRVVMVAFATTTPDHKIKSDYLEKGKLAHKITEYFIKKGAQIFYDQASLTPAVPRQWKICAAWD